MTDPGDQPAIGHVHQEAHAQGEARIYQAGRDQHFHHVPWPVTWPVWVGVVPPQADCYQPRIVTDRLSAITTGGGTAVLRQVLSGLGGVGKTQLAAAYARQLWEAGELDLLLWVQAASRDAIVAGYAQAYAAVTGADRPDAQQAATRLLGWLASNKRSWLIVLDDVTDPGDLRELWPPQIARGRTVVTTRRRDAALEGSGRVVVDVGLFTPAEAAAYLGARLAQQPELALGAERAARQLGYLPLALAQGSAYLIDRHLTCDQYADRLDDRHRRLAELVPEPGALPDDQRSTLAAVWSLSVELADSLAPAGLARPTLELASLLDPEGIPEAMFTADAAVKWLTAAVGRDVRAEAARDALFCLRRVSLATVDETSSARRVRVHALVQRATRDQLTDDRLAMVAGAAADALVEAWPEVGRDIASPSDWPRYRHVAPHVLALLQNTGRHVAQDRLLSLLNAASSVADAYHWAGFSASAMAVTEPALAVSSRLVQHHPTILRLRHQLAFEIGQSGRWVEAESRFREVLVARKWVLGDDHPDTLASCHEHARALANQGRLEEAERAFRRVLKAKQCELGHDHLDTLATRHQLAWVVAEQGRLKEAEGACREVLESDQRVLGVDHPDTLATRHLLARVVAEQAAKSAFHKGLEWGFGTDHATRDDIVWAVQRRIAAENFAADNDDPDRNSDPDMNDDLGLTDLLEHPIFVDPSLEGQDHAWVVASQGRWEEAESIFREVMEARQRVLGSDHRDTLATHDDLTWVVAEQGRWEEAESACRELVAVKQRALGTDHPDTFATRHLLARVVEERGKWNVAESACRELVAAKQRALGVDHPDTLATRHLLARMLARQGRLNDAKGALREVWKARHPAPRGQRNATASAGLSKRARTSEQRRWWKQTEQLLRKVLPGTRGVRHPSPEPGEARWREGS
jgi:tetratricopeptide (TPR) repeat protein